MTDSVDDVAVTDDSGWTATSRESTVLSDYRFALVGAASGLVGGMGAFMFSRYVLMPTWIPLLAPRTWALSVTVLGGASAHLLARDARESAKSMLVGIVVAFLTLVLTRMIPIMLLFPANVWGFALRNQMRPVARTVLVVLTVIYWGGYLTTLFVWGYFWS